MLELFKKSTILAFVSILILASSSAVGQTYDEYMNDAGVAFEKKNYLKSIALLLKANRLRPKPENLFRVARSYEEANDCGMAIVYYKAFLKEKNKKASRKKTAKEAVSKASSCGNYTPDLSGRLFIKSAPPGASVTIDGEAVGVTPVEVAGYIEGKYTLGFKLPKYKNQSEEIEIKAGSDASHFTKLVRSTGKSSTVEENEEEDEEDSFDLEEEDFDGGNDTWSIGLLVGLDYSQINKPSDPAGEPTLLFGAAFSGIGFTGGLTTTLEAVDLGPGALSLRLDLLAELNSVSGFAENKTTGSKQELSFTETSLHAPILIGYTLRISENFPIFFYGGVDLIIATLNTETTQSAGVTPDPLTALAAKNPISLLGVIGTSFQTGDWVIPLDLRFNYNPFTEKSTRARFDGYSSSTFPGTYRVAYDWQVFITLGISKYIF